MGWGLRVNVGKRDAVLIAMQERRRNHLSGDLAEHTVGGGRGGWRLKRSHGSASSPALPRCQTQEQPLGQPGSQAWSPSPRALRSVCLGSHPAQPRQLWGDFPSPLGAGFPRNKPGKALGGEQGNIPRSYPSEFPHSPPRQAVFPTQDTLTCRGKNRPRSRYFSHKVGTHSARKVIQCSLGKTRYDVRRR